MIEERVNYARHTRLKARKTSQEVKGLRWQRALIGGFSINQVLWLSDDSILYDFEFVIAYD